MFAKVINVEYLRRAPSDTLTDDSFFVAWHDRFSSDVDGLTLLHGIAERLGVGKEFMVYADGCRQLPAVVASKDRPPNSSCRRCWANRGASVLTDTGKTHVLAEAGCRVLL